VTPIPILLYHSVSPTAAPGYERWCIAPGRFAAHLDAIVELGFTCLTISGLVDATLADALPPKPLAITFDDGRADFYDHALDSLASRGLPSTMYVVAGHVGGSSDFLGIAGEDDQPMMTWEQLRSASGHGVEIGAHSMTHPQLDIVGRARADDEISRSRTVLEDGLAEPVRSFAYPHGYHTARLTRSVRAAGYDSACAVHDRCSSADDNRFALSRLIVDGDTSTDRLRVLLTGLDVRRRPHRAPLRVGWRLVRRTRQRLGTATP
jgi:peptidoglycan/xylan/chitin deacetylase (PgdA/CDA1 family)